MVWHRGELHSVGSAMIAASVAGLVAMMIGRLLPIGAATSAGLLVRYSSHLLADMASPARQMALAAVAAVLAAGTVAGGEGGERRGQDAGDRGFFDAIAIVLASLHNGLPELLSRDLFKPLLTNLWR